MYVCMYMYVFPKPIQELMLVNCKGRGSRGHAKSWVYFLNLLRTLFTALHSVSEIL